MLEHPQRFTRSIPDSSSAAVNRSQADINNFSSSYGPTCNSGGLASSSWQQSHHQGAPGSPAAHHRNLSTSSNYSTQKSVTFSSSTNNSNGDCSNGLIGCGGQLMAGNMKHGKLNLVLCPHCKVSQCLLNISFRQITRRCLLCCSQIRLCSTRRTRIRFKEK